jgi:hypothetical protein
MMFYVIVTAFMGGSPVHQFVEPQRYRTKNECLEAIPDIARSSKYRPPVGAAFGFNCIQIDERA